MGIKAGIVGWGPVGQRIWECIGELGLECEELRVMAVRDRDELIGDQVVHVNGLGEDFSEEKLALFDGLDVVFCAGREGEKGAARMWGMPAIEHHGCFCVDNGADFRLEPEVPLVVPEINMAHVTKDTRMIASPNCSTIQMCVALAPLREIAPIERVVVTTFQSVSGYGREAEEELRKQLCECNFEDLGTPQALPFDCSVFRKPIVLDCLPHIDAFLDNGYTKEEMKMHTETRKIFGDEGIRVTATTVRVPVPIGHAEAITVEFGGSMDAATALEAWRRAQDEYGLVVIDDPAKDTPGWPPPAPPKDDEYAGLRYAEERSYPTQADVLRDECKNLVLVGRTRDDYTRDNTVSFWCVADNLRKGAATNVVQIGQKLVDMGLVG